MTLSGLTERHSDVRVRQRVILVSIDFCASQRTFTAREQPCIHPVVTVELREALVRKRAARSPYKALWTPSSGEGLKTSASGRRQAYKPSTRAQALAVDAKARRTPPREPKHSASGNRHSPSARRDAVAATAHSHRRFATQVRHRLKHVWLRATGPDRHRRS